MSSKIKISAGYRSNRLVVLYEIEPIKGQRRFRCQCDCGGTSSLYLSHLRNGKTKSCGCWLREKAKQTAIAHFRKPDGTALFNELLRRYRQAASKRNLPFALSAESFKALVAMPCVFCGREPYHVMRRKGRYGTFYYTGVDRLDTALGYVQGNCVPCCKICNYAKQTMSLTEFLAWVKTVHKHTQNMSVNNYMDIAQKATGTIPEKSPSADHTEQVQVGLGYAARQAEKPAQEAPKIPVMGTTPVAN